MSRVCDCEERIKNGLKEHYPDAHLITGQYEILSGRAYVNYTVRLGDKKKIEQMVLCSYCPHCGKPYPKEDAK